MGDEVQVRSGWGRGELRVQGLACVIGWTVDFLAGIVQAEEWFRDRDEGASPMITVHRGVVFAWYVSLKSVFT